MQASEIKAAYARELKETITVRRYTGAGTNRPRFDVAVRGKARQYGATELIGTITQGDWNVLLLVEDLIAEQFALPLTTNDKVVIAGKEIRIKAANSRKAPDGTLIVYDIQAGA